MNYRLISFLLFILLNASTSFAQTISGHVFQHTGASIEVEQAGVKSYKAVDPQTGNWTFTLTRSGPFKVRAFNSSGWVSNPPFLGGSPRDMSGLNFALLNPNQWKQIYGLVHDGGRGIGSATVEADHLGDTTTSDGRDGELPLGMYHFTYQRFSPLGFVRLSASKPGIMGFTPSQTSSISADTGRKDVNFEVPGNPSPTPTPQPTPTPTPQPVTHTLSGTLLDTAGNRLPNIQVWGGPVLGNVYTDSQGNYQFNNIPDGTVIGIGPVYSRYIFGPQSFSMPGGIYGDITQNFTGTPIDAPPVISMQPQDQDINQYYSTRFEVRVLNNQILTNYQWYQDGNIIPGATSPSLQVTGSKANDQSLFRVRITNQYGTVWSDDAVLEVHTVPTVLSNPIGIQIREGESATFRVTAAGEGTLSYFWLTNAFNFPNVNSSSLTVTPSLDANGDIVFPGGSQFGSESGNSVQIMVLVSNQFGNILSQPATLTVLPASGGATPSPSPSPTSSPTTQPSAQPSSQPSSQPSTAPSVAPTPGQPAIAPQPGVSFDTLINDAAGFAAGRLPKGKRALRAYLSQVYATRQAIDSASVALEDAIAQIPVDAATQAIIDQMNQERATLKKLEKQLKKRKRQAIKRLRKALRKGRGGRK